MQPRTARRLTFLAGFTAYFVALWALWPTPIIYPLKVFVVFLHELSHGLAALATGGHIQSISLDWREGGETVTRGGNAFLTLSAGYLGSLAWGLLLLALGRARPAIARGTMLGLGALMLGVSALYVRGAFGLVFGLGFGAALLLASRWLPAAAVRVVVTALGLTSALYALLDIRSDILQRPGAASDAFMLAQRTGIPTLAWGILWSALGLGACIWMMRRLYLKT
jgi:hypothetical protein